MTAIARTMDGKLKTWRTETARKVEHLVGQIIALADEETRPSSRNGSKTRRRDPFLADTTVWMGKTPADLARNHDSYLY